MPTPRHLIPPRNGRKWPEDHS